MSNNIVDLSNLDTWDMIKELQSRGWNTELLWCRDDVQTQLDDINEEKSEDEKIILTDEDKDNILDDLSYEWYCERINEEIYNKILNYE
jgi:DNA-directed RNA polymerase subunit N (RpoN/RPB10)